jgi:ABC-type antimicrobial peptide transport system, ATPase component
MILELKNIFKTYTQGRMDVPVLKDISLGVEAGDYVAIMGPSGSGKTTLMNIIGCLDYPTSGEYYLGDEDVFANSDSRLSDVRLNSIGFVFQSFYLLSRQSALDNVALPLLYAGVRKSERREIARAALERVGLGDRTDFKPTQLSGGQCQRVAIARAMVNSPKILLADEPTGALDTASGEQVMEIFQTLNDEGVTIIMITHEREIAGYAKKVYHIRDGQFVENYETPTSPFQSPKEDINFSPESIFSQFNEPKNSENENAENLEDSAAFSRIQSSEGGLS